jgi:NAD(P)-dependent dehydrogenase (short-subunit alcohol dehydrogenase family)
VAPRLTRTGLGRSFTGKARHMTAGGRRHLASISGRASQPNRVVYNVTKAGLLMLVKTAGQQLAPRGIRVNAVSPGWMWSRNIERRYGTRERADALGAEFHALGRIATPERWRRPCSSSFGPGVIQTAPTWSWTAAIRWAPRRRLVFDKVRRSPEGRSRLDDDRGA